MKTDTLNTLRPGIYIDQSHGSADCLNERIIKFAQHFGFTGEMPEEPENEDDQDACNDYSDALSETADAAVDWLNDQDRLPYCCWTVDDNSLFLSPNVDDARDSCEFVSRDRRSWDETCYCEYDDNGDIEPGTKDPECPAQNYRGEWLHINDHGNATLYVRDDAGQDREIWGVV